MTKQNINPYSEGSKWRKWDLHVHTPDTKLNDQYKITGEDKWKKFCEEIENSDVEVFGITDYFSVENYFTFIKIFNDKYPKSKKVFFPNLELRLEVSVNKAGEEVNIHIIFSNKASKKEIENFLNILETNITKNGVVVKSSDLSNKIDYETAAVDYKKIKADLKSIFGNSDLYLIFAASNNQGLRADSKSPRKMNISDEIDKICDGFIGGSQNSEYYLKENRYEQSKDGEGDLARKSPVISGSDTHSFDDFNEKVGKLFEKNDKNDKICDFSEITWIKADPTFEGLKQIIYEPEERVKIQAENPEFEEQGKVFFDSIEISQDLEIYNNDESKLKFKQTTIPLNKNLVTIIGGRGEGKSTLINYLNGVFDFDYAQDKVYNQSENFKTDIVLRNSQNIVLDDKKTYYGGSVDMENDRFLFIGQDHLYNKQKDFSDEVLKILNLQDESKFDEKIAEKFYQINQKIDQINDWLQKEVDGIKINSTEYNEGLKSKYSTILTNLSNSKTKSEIEKYLKNLKLKSALVEKENKAKQIKELTESYYQNIKQIATEKKDDEVINIFKIPNPKKYLGYLDYEIEQINIEKGKLDNENIKIKIELGRLGIYGDLESIISDTEKYQNIISSAEQNIKTVEFQEAELKKFLEERCNFGKKVVDFWQQISNSIETSWNTFKNSKSSLSEEKQKVIKELILKEEDLKIEGEVIFDTKQFVDELKNISEDKKFDKISELDSYQTWQDYISNDLNDVLDGIHKKHINIKTKILDLFFKTEIRQKYLFAKPKILLNNVEFSKLSAGQKGTIYLRLKLAEEAFNKIIIFDQPEDNLDNKFIMQELVTIFKELKKYRQIIIVTHNANLVVNSDAEQVIVAKNNRGVLSYISGSLENAEIQKEVCEILEGGEIAFEKRRKRYTGLGKS